MRCSSLAAPAVPAEAEPDDELLAALGHDPVGIDALLERVGGDAGLLGGRLLALELAGLVEQLPGGRVQRLVR